MKTRNRWRALLRALMATGPTVEENWREINRLDPETLIGFTPYVTRKCSKMLLDKQIELVDRRHVALLAEMCLHRVTFDLMGLERDHHAEILGRVSHLFFS